MGRPDRYEEDVRKSLHRAPCRDAAVPTRAQVGLTTGTSEDGTVPAPDYLRPTPRNVCVVDRSVDTIWMLRRRESGGAPLLMRSGEGWHRSSNWMIDSPAVIRRRGR